MVTASQTRLIYGFWTTLMWGALALLVPFAIVAFCYQYFLHGDPDLNDRVFILAQVGSVVVVLCAVRLKRWDILDYLRLTAPIPREALLAIAGAVALLLLQFVIANATGRWFRMPAPVHLAMFPVLSILVLSPIAEEIVFRGFMFPALARSAIEPWGAIVLLAIVFAVLHDGAPFSHCASGLLFGWLRWRTDSVTAPILAHAATNAGVLSVGLQGYGWHGF